jgi:hypothetical protein
MEDPSQPVQLYNPGNMEGVRGALMLWSNIPTFPLPCVSQGSASTCLCYMSPTVWISVCGNNYAQRNMRGQGSNSRPPGSDTMMEDPPQPVQLYNPSNMEGARGPLMLWPNIPTPTSGHL